MAVLFIHNSSVQEVGHILGLLVQQSLGSPVDLNRLEALRGLHLPGYDECPCLHHQACKAATTWSDHGESPCL